MKWKFRTLERWAPLKLTKPTVPRFEMTGTITLPKSFLASEPVTLRKPTPLAPRRLEPPPKPKRLPPPPRFEAPPAPAPALWRSVADEMDLAPTPIQELPFPPLPFNLVPKPPRRAQ